MSQNPESILIILMGALGDVARGLCVVGPLKREYPDATLHWLVEPKWEPLLSLHSGIDQTIVFDRPRGIAALPDLYNTLKSTHFDLVLDSVVRLSAW